MRGGSSVEASWTDGSLQVESCGRSSITGLQRKAVNVPNCFQLYPKGSNKPAILQDVDAAICAHFGVPVDPVQWIAGWYHVIGFLIACRNGCHLGSAKLRAEVIAWYDDVDYSGEGRT